MGRRHTVVIGAGIGGLSCALALAARGENVTVIERASQSGGKARQISVGGRPIDSGPTVFTMRWVFDEIFALAGADFGAQVVLTPLEVLARHAWGPDERLDLFADVGRSAETIADFSGAEEARGFARFCADAARTYRTLKDTFMTQPRPAPWSLPLRIGLGRTADLFALRPFSRLWPALGDYFRDPRLRQLFARYATYVGSSPFLSPATLMLIAHVEQDGVWSVSGGLSEVARAMQRVAESNGAKFRFDAHVKDIVAPGNRVAAVTLATGERIAADAVVMNGDPAALAAGLLGEDARAAVGGTAFHPGDRSLSALTWSVVGTARDFPLQRHNVFFGRDYAREFDQLFMHRILPDDPTIYVCAQDRGDAEPPSARDERLFILVNAPAVGDAGGIAESQVAACQVRVLEILRHYGLHLDWAPTNSVATSPAQFHALFPGTGGALYGQAAHSALAPFRRPASHTKIKGLYLAGGATHPGPGIPMAALSGRLAAQRLLTDRGST